MQVKPNYSGSDCYKDTGDEVKVLQRKIILKKFKIYRFEVLWRKTMKLNLANEMINQSSNEEINSWKGIKQQNKQQSTNVV